MTRSARKNVLALTLALVAAGLAMAIFIVARRGSSSPTTLADAPEERARPSSAGSRRSLPTIALEMPADGVVAAPTAIGANTLAPSHRAGPKCESCSAVNCAPATSSCDLIGDVAERKLCEELYACFTDPANNCVSQGDAVKCWCGTNPTTCLTARSGPTSANGPCLDKIFAGAKSNDPPTIRERFLDPAFPLGRAVAMTGCRGAFCSSECKVE